jgi:hypothetical protein
MDDPRSTKRRYSRRFHDAGVSAWSARLRSPAREEMRKLSAPTDKVELTLMSRAKGLGLDTIWHTLSLEQRSSYKDQLGDAIKKWRQFTSPMAQKVNGDLLDDCLIGIACIAQLLLVKR